MDSFDADVLIFAASLDHSVGDRVRALLEVADRPVGSVLLLPELLVKPIRSGWDAERDRLLDVLSRLDLIAVDEATASAAVALSVKYALRTPDAVHLATAVAVGADRFVTNNRKDFPRSIDEVEIVYPDDLVA